jgi:hypothetical protein
MKKNNRFFVKWNGHTQNGYHETEATATDHINDLKNRFFNKSDVYTIHTLDNNKVITT